MTITEKELTEARTAWGKGLIDISSAYDKDGIDEVITLAAVSYTHLRAHET